MATRASSVIGLTIKQKDKAALIRRNLFESVKILNFPPLSVRVLSAS